MSRHDGGRSLRRQVIQATMLLAFLVCQAAAGHSVEARSIEVTVLEPIDVGDVLVMNREPVEVEVAATGHRASRSGRTAFGSLPHGPGRLRLLGEPGACLRLIGGGSGSSGDAAGRIDVARIQLRGPDGVGQEEIYLRLDSNGLAFVDVGVELRLRAVERSKRWRLSLRFQAEYSEDCL